MARMVLLDSTGNLENTVQMAKMGKVALLGQSGLVERLELAEHQVKLEQVKKSFACPFVILKSMLDSNFPHPVY